MIVLGIDPGTEVMGYGVVASEGSCLRCVDAGVLRTTGELARRLCDLRDGLEVLFDRFAPASVAIEEVFVHKNVRTAIRLGQAQAVLFLAAGARGLAVAGYPPATVKRAVVGNGRAHKLQVRTMVGRLLGIELPTARFDATDALGVAICHAQATRTAARVARAR